MALQYSENNSGATGLPNGKLRESSAISATETRPWTIDDSNKLYYIGRWGDGFFSVNDEGHLTVLPTKTKSGPVIDMVSVIEEIEGLGIKFPAVIRFHDILRFQVVYLNETFNQVIREASFKGRYFGVFPIKVNQMREVVEEVVDAGTPYNYGLEAGSKPELLAVLAYNTNKESLTILNGYKDEDYLRLALMGRKLGRKIIVVIEKLTELSELIRLSKEMNVFPLIGLRAKVSATGTGKWKESGGDRAKFGLTTTEILEAIDILKREQFEESLKLFHFHIGSQVTDIRNIKDAVVEGARIYAKLKSMGVNLEYFDVGGGLGVDYDGSKSAFESSRNYTTKDYIEDVVYILKDVCDQENVPHPNIVTESGRFITAHHSCVIFNVFGQIGVCSSSAVLERGMGEHHLVRNMRTLYEELSDQNYQEIYNDSLLKKDECLQAFKLGILKLEDRAKIETLYWMICKRIYSISQGKEYIPEEIKELKSSLSDQYLCNFSVFQSLADSWGVGQLFPIVPIQKLNERPTQLCSLVDISCDSDGKVSKFIDFESISKTLPLHKLSPQEKYYVGVFMTGAYQDIMGDMHNLFGRVNEVHVFSDDDDPTDFYIEEVIKGHTSEDILSMLQYNPRQMALSVKKELDQQIQLGNLRPRESVFLSDFYEACLSSYTYLKN